MKKNNEYNVNELVRLFMFYETGEIEKGDHLKLIETENKGLRIEKAKLKKAKTLSEKKKILKEIEIIKHNISVIQNDKKIQKVDEEINKKYVLKPLTRSEKFESNNLSYEELYKYAPKVVRPAIKHLIKKEKEWKRKQKLRMKQ